ncbi:MAG: GNAT family N-acetyltransferase [Acutalibacter sp.]|nr:GNAT family N-acetyltransferase [Acutalibacter sp.]
MKIVSATVTDEIVLGLFSEHDDAMMEFLGEDKGLYTRYDGQEGIEKVWVIYVDDLPAGCVAYRRKESGVGEVKRLFVRSQYRGQGLSKPLLKTVEAYAREQGCNTLFLDTRITLEPAVSLYKKFGFSVVFQQGLYIQMEKKI